MNIITLQSFIGCVILSAGLSFGLVTHAQSQTIHISDIQGKIQVVLVSDWINPEDGATNSDDFQSLVVNLARHMVVKCALYSKTNPSAFASNVEVSSVDTLKAYLSFLERMDNTVPIIKHNTKGIIGRFSWSEFVSAFDDYNSGTKGTQKFFDKKDRFFSKLSERIAVTDELAKRKMNEWISDAQERLIIENIDVSQVQFVDLDTIKLPSKIDDICSNCNATSTNQINPYVQDALRVIERAGKKIAVPICCFPEHDQSVKLAYHLMNVGVVDAVEPAPYILEGGNILSGFRHQFLADYALDDTVRCNSKKCDWSNGISKDLFMQKFSKEYLNVEWLKIEKGIGGLLSRLDVTLPYYHLDLFLTFGDIDTVYLGQIKTDYYLSSYQLTEKSLTEIQRVNGRLNGLGRILRDSLNYVVVRIPLVPVYDEEEKLEGVLSFNNCLTEIIDSSQTRNVCIPSYNFEHGKQVDWTKVKCDLNVAFEGWNLIWIHGENSLSRNGALRCRAKVVSRN